ncbi:hypothetical protein ACY76_25305, partial [Salmonella enterica]|nr:hypothetical protein [Salmonella enterica]
ARSACVKNHSKLILITVVYLKGNIREFVYGIDAAAGSKELTVCSLHFRFTDQKDFPGERAQTFLHIADWLVSTGKWTLLSGCAGCQHK